MRSHKNLKIWEKVMLIIERIYQHTGNFPREEVYGLTSQIRRASVSVASNIAEGAARKRDPRENTIFHRCKRITE